MPHYYPHTIAKCLIAHNQINRYISRKPVAFVNVCLLNCIIILSLSFFNLIPNKVLGVTTGPDPHLIIKLVNDQRQLHKLTPLVENEKLKKAAANKAQDMMNKGYWDHYSPDSFTPWQFITKEGYTYQFAGENLAKDYYLESSLVSDWMNSQGHRDNILSDKFEDTGVAVIKGNFGDKPSILIVQLFGKEFSQAQIESIYRQGARIINQNTEVQNVLTNQPASNIAKSVKNVLLTAFAIVTAYILVWDMKKNLTRKNFTKIAKRYWITGLLLLTNTSLLITGILIDLL